MSASDHNAANQPRRVLFACTHNAIRSPMAAALGNHLFGDTIEFASVGVKADETNPFAMAIMDEIGIDLSTHVPRNFTDLEDASYDLIISLTPEAQHHAIELTRQGNCEAIYWPTLDPSLADGSRNTILEAFREVRDSLASRINEYFGAVDGH